MLLKKKHFRLRYFTSPSGGVRKLVPWSTQSETPQAPTQSVRGERESFYLAFYLAFSADTLFSDT